MQIARIGLDLAKYAFEIHGVDAHGLETVAAPDASSACRIQRFSQTCRRALSAAAEPRTAHTFGRRRFWTLAMMSALISPQFVTPNVKSNKNDRNGPKRSVRQLADPTCASCPSSPPNS